MDKEAKLQEGFEERTVWMWACPTHGVQPVHYVLKGSRSGKRFCHCGDLLYETLDPLRNEP